MTTNRIFHFTATAKGETLNWTIRHWNARWAKLELPYPYRVTAALVARV